MTSLGRELAELDLRASSRPFTSEEKARAAAEADARAAEIGPFPRPVLLVEPRPLAFVFALAALIDRGHLPIPIGADASAFQRQRVREGLPGALLWEGDAIAPSLEPGPDDARAYGAYGCLTSGTTSSPKLCVLSIEGARANARAHAASLGIGREHTVLQSLPLHHSFGIVAYLFTALEARCALDFYPAFLTFRAIAKRKVQRAVLHVSPSQARFLIGEKAEAPEGLEVVSVGAGTCEPGELAELSGRLPRGELFVTYGLTEAGPRVTTGRYDGSEPSTRHGYIGRALGGVSLSVEEEGRVAGVGVGQLLVRSPSLKRNLEPNELGADGRSLATRDRVELLPSGEVLFLSRAGDLLKIGGVSVYPRDIEAVCRAHPGVTDCVVLRSSDRVYDDVFDLVIESAIDEATLASFVNERLVGAHRPRRIHVLTALPRSALGKIERARLREILVLS